MALLNNFANFNSAQPSLAVDDTAEMSGSSDRNCVHCGNLFSGQSQFCCHACETLYQLNQGETDLSAVASRHHLRKYLHLDQDEFQQTFRRPNNEFVFYVQGLECTSCVHLLEKLPEINADIESATLHFGENTLRVQLKKNASLALATSLIEEMGYVPSLINENDDTEELHKNENRTMLIRMAVAGAATGNIMLFVIPIYAGLAGAWATAFHWISFFLFLPVVGFCAWPFYRGAWTSLKYKHLSIDLPITIALVSTFIYSTFSLIVGKPEMYFDSTSSFMFLILTSRYLVKRLQQQALHDNVLAGFSSDQALLVLMNSEWKLVPSNKIQIGQTVQLKPDQILTFDGVLLSDSTDFDTSLITGEPLPRFYNAGMTVPAGAKSLQTIQLKVLRAGQQTELGRMLKSIEEESLRKTAFVSLTDKLSQALIALVISTASIYFILSYQSDFHQALTRALSLFIIACPCALALGTPLTFAWALKRAKQFGVLVRSTETFEKLPKIKTLILDKTGTITEGNLSLLAKDSVLSSNEKSILLGLELISNHPIARAIRNEFKNHPASKLQNLQEQTGIGVSGHFEGDRYELIQSKNVSPFYVAVDFLKNGKLIACLKFEDRIRMDSSREIGLLKKIGLNISLSSGDSIPQVQKVAAAVGIKSDHAYGAQSPQQKKNLVDRFNPCLMVGDGANDSLALQTASVGAAMMGSMSLALSTSDVHFIQPGLAPLRNLFCLGQKTKRTLNRNLTFALIYNLSAGIAALCGYINPLTAAVLMPISSALIAFSTWWGLR